MMMKALQDLDERTLTTMSLFDAFPDVPPFNSSCLHPPPHILPHPFDTSARWQVAIAIAARLRQSSTFCTLAAFGKVIAKVKKTIIWNSQHKIQQVALPMLGNPEPQ